LGDTHIDIFLQEYMKKITITSYFTKNLLAWHKNDNVRAMPWKEERNPYRIWLSEIILQQTRVAQGLDYYNKFIIRYPTVEKLANAEENAVFKLWEGLGYYSRCKNLIASARFIAFELGGKFPNTYEAILKLKGVGPYTASAIASFAYNLPNAVVDGNVLRVLARYFGINKQIDSIEGKKYFTELAQSLLDKGSPALYNQAIMDFGATICKPKIPLCNTCIFKKTCIAFKKKIVQNLPVKGKKLEKKKRYFYYIIASCENKIYVRKRTEKDIWQNLWEFILIEQAQKIELDDFLASTPYFDVVGKKSILKHSSIFYKQQLTHQTIEGVFIHLELKSSLKNHLYSAIDKNKLKNLAFPRFITNYFEKSEKW
jgi:A/G-specific adenine glycosylase